MNIWPDFLYNTGQRIPPTHLAIDPSNLGLITADLSKGHPAFQTRHEEAGSLPPSLEVCSNGESPTRLKICAQSVIPSHSVPLHPCASCSNCSCEEITLGNCLMGLSCPECSLAAGKEDLHRAPANAPPAAAGPGAQLGNRSAPRD